MQKIGLVAIFDTASFTKGLNIYVNGLNQANNQTAAVSNGVSGLARVFQNTLGYIARDVIMGAARAVGDFAGDTIDSARSFETAWTGVMKTVDGTVRDGEITGLGKILRQDFRDLAKEIPVTVEELAGIGEIGGQLGVEAGGIIDFTRVIAELGVTTNLSTQEAAVGVARFMNVMGTSQEETRNVGSAIVDLGNNFATSESEILSFSQRIAASGRISNLTEGDVLGISAAFSSVGLQAQAGGTAVQKVLLAMDEAVANGGDKLDQFAAISGMTSAEFATTWKDNSAQAFNDFVGGLGEAGSEASGYLAELELNDSRLKTAFLSLAQDSTILTRAINDGNEAFDAGNALATEADLRFGTFDSQVQILKNVFNDLKISVGDQFLPVFSLFIDRIKEFIDSHGPEIEAAITVIGDVIAGLGAIILGMLNGEPFDWSKLIPASLLKQGQDALDALTKAFNDFKPVIDIVVGALAGAGLALLIQGIVAVVVALGTALGTVSVPFLLIGAAVVALGAIVSSNWEVIQPVLQALGEAFMRVFEVVMTNAKPGIDQLMAALQPLGEAFVGLWEALQPVLAVLGGVLVVALGIAGAAIAAVVTGLVNFIGGLAEVLTGVVNWISAIVGLFTEGIGLVVAIITGDTEKIVENFNGFKANFEAMTKALWETILAIITTVLNTVVSVVFTFIESIIAFFTGLYKTLVGGSIIPDMVNAILKWFTTLAKDTIAKVKAMIDDIVKWFKELPVKIKTIIEDVISTAKSFVSKFTSVGRDLVGGLVDGIKAAAGRALDAAKGVVQGALNAAKALLGINSPSREFAKLGVGIDEGLAKGVSGAAMLPINAIQSVTSRMITQPIASTTNNTTNSRQTNVNVNANYIGQQSQQGIYFDVAAALSAVG